MQQRNQALDVLKGIGIIFVVMGHMDSSQIGGSVISYIYSFHMPLFFFVSGYFTQIDSGLTFRTYFLKKVKSILLPYALLFSFSIFYGHIIVRFVLKQYVIPFNLYDTLKAFVLSSEWLNSIPTFNFPLWFLPVLFLSSIAFYFISQAKKDLLILLLSLFCVIITIPVQAAIPGRPPLGLNAVPPAVAFMGSGFLFRKYQNHIKIHFVFLLPLLGFTLWAAYMYPANIQQINHYIYFPAAVASIYIYYRLSIDLASSKILSYLGRNSLIVFGVHALISYTYQFSPFSVFFQYWNGLIVFCINLGYNLTLSSLICFIVNIVKKFLSTKIFYARNY